MLMFGYREKERPWSLNFSTNHTNQSMFKSEQLCELWVRRHGLSQGIASMKREISKYTEKKTQQREGTCYQGHMDKKKLKIALKERKYIHADKPACGLRVWKKATCSLNKDASLWFLLSLGKMRPIQKNKKKPKSYLSLQPYVLYSYFFLLHQKKYRSHIFVGQLFKQYR